MNSNISSIAVSVNFCDDSVIDFDAGIPTVRLGEVRPLDGDRALGLRREHPAGLEHRNVLAFCERGFEGLFGFEVLVSVHLIFPFGLDVRLLPFRDTT